MLASSGSLHASSEYAGSVCIGRTCLSARSVRRSRLSWQGLLGAHTSGAGSTGACSVREGALIYGCPYHDCRVSHPGFCKALGTEATFACAPPRTRRSHATPCFQVRPSERHLRFAGDTKDKPRTCTGSMGEESLMLHHFFRSTETGSAMRGGTFLELGAFDGLMESNTLHLEQCLGWKGLLVEGATGAAELIGAHRPHALALRMAICPTHGTASFSPAGTYGQLRRKGNSSKERRRSGETRGNSTIASAGTIEVPCAAHWAVGSGCCG